VSRHRVDGGDLGTALELIGAMRRRLEKLGKPVRVVSIYEAGYDGFWRAPRRRVSPMEEGSIQTVVD
ncbi:MAG TPA: hypothetical protein VHJ58_09795, partial [Vicinamibacterales bacterium]|nr:hypothetical protein [Vicinamibacterales bacterium]